MHLDRIVERQAGAIGRAQAFECGLSDDQVARRVASGRFPLARVAVEVDGWARHVDVDRFRADRRKDRRKQNALVLDGWTVLRFTWHDLVNRPDAVVAQLRAALRHAA